MGRGRRSAPGRRTGVGADSGTGGDDDDEEDETGTSVDDLTSEADPQEFDQTFTDADALLTIAGNFDPAAGSKQVIPRIAYTINYNFVWNPDRGRWEPDEGNEITGGSSPATTLQKTSNQTFSSSSARTTIRYDQGDVDTLNGAEVSNNQIRVPDTGVYLLLSTVGYEDLDANDEIETAINVNGLTVGFHDGVNSGAAGPVDRSQSLHTVEQLNAGDTVTGEVLGVLSSNATIVGSPVVTYLEVIQLST